MVDIGGIVRMYFTMGEGDKLQIYLTDSTNQVLGYGPGILRSGVSSKAIGEPLGYNLAMVVSPDSYPSNPNIRYDTDLYPLGTYVVPYNPRSDIALENMKVNQIPSAEMVISSWELTYEEYKGLLTAFDRGLISNPLARRQHWVKEVK